MSSSFAFVGEHGSNIYNQLDIKYKFSDAFKRALQVLAFFGSVVIVAVSYDGLTSLPKQISGHQEAKHSE